MRHPLHSICPYFAMFPEDFVARQLLAYTRRGDVVFDPFCGRGTTIFESLLNGRRAAGVDINPVAACISGAKADPPTLPHVLRRLAQLEKDSAGSEQTPAPLGDFFRMCFHERTLGEILFLRRSLDWRGSKVDRFIAAIALACLHGESHKSQNCLSNRMPRTISTKPAYSVRWWEQRSLLPPERRTFDILRTVARFRLSEPLPTLRGSARLGDARRAGYLLPSMKETVHLIVTSPPYLDTTDYQEDQWLRLWFLGGPDYPTSSGSGDNRHTNRAFYWEFLAEAWAGCSDLVRRRAVVVIRAGGARIEREELAEGLQHTLERGFAGRRVREITPVSTSEIRNRQTNVFRPGTSPKRYEHDFTYQLG